MYNAYQTNEQWMKWNKEEFGEFGDSTWCGPSVINDDTNWSLPELRIFDATGGVMSVGFDELEEIDALIGELYVLRKRMTDDYVLDTDRGEPGFYPRNAKLKLVP